MYRAPHRMIGGVPHKACYGPMHPDGAWVPTYGFYARSKGDVVSYRCKQCHTMSSGAEPYMLLERHVWIIEELVMRVGSNEAARRTGCAKQSMWRWRTGKQRYIRRDTLRKIIPVLRDARLKDEWRNERSIRRGTTIRGERDKPLPPRNRAFRTPDEQARADAEWDKRHNEELKQKRKRLREKRRRQREWVRRKRAAAKGET